MSAHPAGPQCGECAVVNNDGSFSKYAEEYAVRMCPVHRAAPALLEALEIITRACEAGAYVGKTSPAVTQARAAIAQAKGAR